MSDSSSTGRLHHVRRRNALFNLEDPHQSSTLLHNCVLFIDNKYIIVINTKKYHVFAPMGRFQLESIYLYFPPSSHSDTGKFVGKRKRGRPRLSWMNNIKGGFQSLC